MRVNAIAAVIAAGVTLGIETLEAQEITNGGLTGTIRSASVVVPPVSGGASAAVFTTPPTGNFVLTQVCLGTMSMAIEGSTFGLIPTNNGLSGGAVKCTAFHPGIALPQGETLTCIHEESFQSTCVITGVLSKK